MIPTPHIAARSKDEIAKTVIMPGDPRRARWIAHNFLESPVLFNNIRDVQGYTGTWKGKPVSVMASGMGIPSISIYAYELYNFYDVDLIIRTGTCGSIQPHVNVHDIIVADKAYSNSSFADQFSFPEEYLRNCMGDEGYREFRKTAPSDEQTDTLRLPWDFPYYAYPPVTGYAEEIALKVLKDDPDGHEFHKGAVLTQEIYYSRDSKIINKWDKKDVLAFEMEAAALFANATQARKTAAAIFTVSNNILTGEEMDPEEREQSLYQMVNIALELAISPASENKPKD